MKVQDVIELAQIQSDEMYEVDTWVHYINLALDDLTPVAKILVTKEDISLTPVNGNVSFSLPESDLEDYHEILDVFVKDGANPYMQLRRLPSSNTFSRGWRQEAESLILQNLGESDTVAMKVNYYRKLRHATPDAAGLSAEIDIPEQYTPLVVAYVCAKSQQKEEELDDKNDFFAEYLRGRNNMAMDRIWEMEPHNRRFLRKARVLSQVGFTQS